MRLNISANNTLQRGSTLNYILLRLAGVRYLTLIDVHSGYHNLKLDEQSLYLTTLSSPFGRYRYTLWPFGVTSVGDMFQKEIEKLICGMPNVFRTADDTLIAGFDEQGRDHNSILHKVLRIYRQANWKLNKDKCLLDAPAFLSSVK